MHITRSNECLKGDPDRVIARCFVPGKLARIRVIADRVHGLTSSEVSSMLATLVSDYGQRHKNIQDVFRQNYTTVCVWIGEELDVDKDRQRLLGAYFTFEYSLESAALFNPSMVLHPDQSGMPRGTDRFIMSLRACGEGHISSIEFRTGVVDAKHRVSLDPPTQYASTARPMDDALYDKHSFFLKLWEMNAQTAFTESVLELLEDEFTMRDLKEAIEKRRPQVSLLEFQDMTSSILWLAHSNYELEFPSDSVLSERVIFPVSESESRGIEDARFVRFTYPDGQIVYYATYTAYNGIRTLPQFIETSDFKHFKLNTLNGKCVQDKGMALFPRKVGDKFMMAGRLDGENLYLLQSDNIHFWNDSKLLYGPKYPWEFVQVGNCGSPIETELGWILLTHAVGPVRQYWLGALLLDLDDPSQVIGELREPLLMPNAAERNGYVPNVVYSCGALRHGDHLIIPYAASDSRTLIASVSIPELLQRLRS